jgi:hypothetical protein
MGEQDRREEALAPGHWRVTATPYSVAAAPAVAAPAGAEAGPVSALAAPSRRTGGRPLIATAICAGVLLLWLASNSSIHPRSGVGPAYFVGVALGGAFFGAILWGISFAITIRKASRGWKLGSLAALVVLGGLVAFAKVGSPSAAAPVAPVQVQVPVVREGK